MDKWFTGVGTQTRVLERQVTVAATFDPLHLPALRPPLPVVSHSVSKLVCAIVQHHSSATFVSMRFHHCQEKFGPCFRNVIFDMDMSYARRVRTASYSSHTSHSASHVLHQRTASHSSYILHLTPYVLHLTPYVLHLTPYTLRFTSYTLRLTSYILRLTSYTLRRTSSILYLISYRIVFCTV
jgi:hypothetical protein